MAKFLFVYYGGKMAATPNEIEKVNTDWTNWLKSLGKSLVDGGMPTMPAKTVTSTGVKDGFIGTEPVGGYSIVQAADADAAAKLAKTAPGVKEGMKVAVYALMDMMMPAKK